MSGPVRLDALVGAMARRGAPLPSETALFVVLQAVESAAASPGGAVRLGPEAVVVSPEGTVTVAPEAPPASPAEAVGAVAALLESVLAPPPLDLVARARGGELASLDALAPELEALLVPLNRGAARRVLGRLVREHARATAAPATPPPPDAPPDDARDLAAGVLAAATESDELARPRGGDALDTLVDAPAPGATDTVPDAAAGAWDDAPPARRAPSRGGAVALAALATVLFASAGVFLAYRVRAAAAPTAPAAPPAPAPAAAREVRARRAVTAPVRSVLTVTSAPAGAEVFVFRGRAPVEVERLATGVAHEFVATLEGRAASRAAVPADAPWEPAADGARFELALQLPPLPPGVVALTALPPGEVASPVAPPRGNAVVRVLTTPPGARVYQRVGLTGPLLVEGLPVTEVLEVLAWKPGHRLERVTVPPAEWHLEGSGRVATVRFVLTPLTQGSR